MIQLKGEFKMIVFIDGPQCVGKSTLINYLINHSNFKNYKFDFSKYSKTCISFLLPCNKLAQT